MEWEHHSHTGSGFVQESRHLLFSCAFIFTCFTQQLCHSRNRSYGHLPVIGEDLLRAETVLGPPNSWAVELG